MGNKYGLDVCQLLLMIKFGRLEELWSALQCAARL